MNKKQFIPTIIISTVSLLTIIGCDTTVNNEEELENLEVKFVVTDAMQTSCYDGAGNIIEAPQPGDMYFGQDAQYVGIAPSYTDNKDGTVTDNNTGLMWQQTPPSEKMTYDEALEYVENLKLGGYSDWRLPTIKESFSIAMFDGKLNPEDTSLAQPYIDTEYFDFFYDEEKPYTGSYWTSTVCKMPATNDYEEMEKNYGFNWADGHLKSYADGYNVDGSSTGFSIPAGVRAVRGDENIYGVNDFKDNNDGTISDKATGLMWSAKDSGWVNDDGTIRELSDENYGYGRTWVETLAWVEKMNEEEYLGYSDWRLPDIKELQSIVEYEKTVIPALDTDFFDLSREDCFVWSSTTCGDFPEMANYIAFGKGYGINIMDEFQNEIPNQADSTSQLRLPPINSSDNNQMGPPPMNKSDNNQMGRPPINGSDNNQRDTLPIRESDISQISTISENNIERTTNEATIDDFVDVHGPGCMRADYKDATSVITQAPKLSRDFWQSIYGEDYPYPFDEENTTTEFDLSNSENAADYIVIYNYALLVRNIN